MGVTQSDRRRAIEPTGVERPFEAHELFWSTTDRKGIITSGNDVFARVSAYGLEDMLGKPHNLIRHPDMPRGVFRLLWDYLEADRPIAAYVQNLAADGGHYWVLAYVAPTDGGYLSIRLKPSSDLFREAISIYERVRAFEREHERDLARRKEMIRAARDMLLSLVQDAGFESYDAFMQTALATEVDLRARTIGEPVVADDEADASAIARSELGDVVAQLGEWSSATRALREQATTIARVADDIGLVSLNAQIASTRLGDEGRALLAVAALLTAQADDLQPVVQAQVDRITQAAAMLDGAGDVSFAIAVVRLQLDLLVDALQNAAHIDQASLQVLVRALETGLKSLTVQFEQLHGRLAAIDDEAAQVRRSMDRLRALEVNGRIETSRLEHGSDLGRMFTDIGEHLRAAHAALGDRKVASIVRADALHRVERAFAQLVAPITAAAA